MPRSRGQDSAKVPSKPAAVTQELWQDWRTAERELLAFFDAVGASADASTVGFRIYPQETESPIEFERWLRTETRDDGFWSFVTAENDDGSWVGYAMPVARPATDPLAFMFVELHTELVVWWLTYAWRARELATAARSLASQGDIVAAASCVRPLVETAAAMWVDGRDLARTWAELKSTGMRMVDAGGTEQRASMLSRLTTILLGSKFDERVPDIKEKWGLVERGNVLGPVEKLARVTPGDLQGDYQWLCNTVHPSLGNYLVYCAPSSMHKTKTHSVQTFAGRSIAVGGRGEANSQVTVETAVARAAATSLRSLYCVFDASLRMIDDVALTSGAPSLAIQPYWRNISPVSPYTPCPCRSGKKAKWCLHRWGDVAPEFPASLRPPSSSS